MKKIILITLVLLPLLLIGYDFDNGGVRNAALGNTGISSSNDASASVWNPSLLAGLNRYSFVTDYRLYSIQLDNDDVYQAFGYGAFPTAKYGTFGVSFSHFNSDVYSEGKMGLSFGRNLFNEKFQTGLGFNLLYKNHDDVDSNISESKTAFDLDLGLSYKPIPQITLGLKAGNLLSADMGINDEDKVPRNFGLGATTDLNAIKFMLDIKYEDDVDSDVIVGFGTEYKLAENFDLRAGIDKYYATAGFGLRFFTNHKLLHFDEETEEPADVRALAISLDYAFNYPLTDIESEYGDHFAGVNVDFGMIKADKKKLLEIFPERFARFGEADTVYVEKVKVDTIVQRVTIRDTVKVVQKEADAAAMRKLFDQEYANLKAEEIKKMNQATIHLTNSLKYFYAGEYQKAIEECEIAIEIAPKLALAYLRLGSIYMKLGNEDEAIYYWEQAYELDPNNIEIKNLLESRDKEQMESADEFLPEF